MEIECKICNEKVNTMHLFNKCGCGATIVTNYDSEYFYFYFEFDNKKISFSKEKPYDKLLLTLTIDGNIETCDFDFTEKSFKEIESYVKAIILVKPLY